MTQKAHFCIYLFIIVLLRFRDERVPVRVLLQVGKTVARSVPLERDERDRHHRRERVEAKTFIT